MAEKPLSPDALPGRIEDEAQLEELLARPTPEVVDLFGRLEGTLAVVGAGGKIGPSLTAMACRARERAAADLEIAAVDRYPEPGVRTRLERLGARTVTCDLLNPDAVARLQDAQNVIYMVGLKFGTTGNEAATWATNTMAADYVARRYRDARIVVFSTGCVYDLVPAASDGSAESDPLEPQGEYANACVARERVFQFLSARNDTAMVLMRLNYAVEMRYGVLVDLASAVLADQPVDLTMGYLNCVWQGDVNAAALRLLEHAAAGAPAINVTGAEKLSVRDAAGRLADLMGRTVRFEGAEADTALLSDASRAHRLLGPPCVPIAKVIEWTADWIARGGRTLGKPTHFQTRDGRY